MKIADLEIELNNLKLKNVKYSLGGGYLEDGTCISKEKDFWQVYYCERGSKNIIGMFPTENDACEYILCICKKESDQNRWF